MSSYVNFQDFVLLGGPHCIRSRYKLSFVLNIVVMMVVVVMGSIRRSFVEFIFVVMKRMVMIGYRFAQLRLG